MPSVIRCSISNGYDTHAQIMSRLANERLLAADTTDTETLPTSDAETSAGPSPAGTNSSKKGNRLSVGAAAGIGAGGALFVVAFCAIIFFIFRKVRQRKRVPQQAPPAFASTHRPSIAPKSPPPQFSSPYEQPQEAKMVYTDPPPMALAPNQYGHRSLSHELDTSGFPGTPPISAYQSQSASMTPRQFPSPSSTGIIAPQPRSPAPPLSRNGLHQYPQPQSQVSPPIGAGQRTPGSNNESGYGFPSQDASPNPESESLHFQHGAASPDSQQRLQPRRPVGAGNMRVSR